MNTFNANQRTFCCIRQLDGLIDNTSLSLSASSQLLDQKVAKFVDLDQNSHRINEDNQSLLHKLVNEKILTKLDESKVRRYSVKWTGESLEESQNDTHVMYLSEFAKDFIAAVQNVVRECVDFETLDRLDDSIYCEVLHHIHFGRAKNSFFFGREDSLSEVRKYLIGTSGRSYPMIIHGVSGSGKTSVLARCSMLANAWSEDSKRWNVIVRFLGTSPNSSNILHVLQSLIFQLHYIMRRALPSINSISKMQRAKRYFWTLLEDISKSERENIIIFLDSIDQLQATNGAHELHWLPKFLPKNVRIVISVISDVTTCLANARKKFPNNPFFHEISPLPMTTADEIMREYLIRNRRTVTTDQRAVVLQTFEYCQQPLFLKLMLDSALAWKSYTPVTLSTFPRDVRAMIEKYFDGLERAHGRVFVSRTLGYLTCGRGGLSELEIEDVLSCDDQVLSNVYVYHDPPVEQRIRIPSLMWVRLQDDLDQYLVERQVEGKDVFAWYHRQFLEAAFAKYCSVNESFIQLHSALADIYAQEKGIRKTLTLEKRKNKTFVDADRGVTGQMLTIKNVRKLNSLPYHLLLSQRTDDLRHLCLINFRWLFTKLMALGISEIVSEYASVLEKYQSDDIELMQNFFELSYEALKIEPLLFAYQLTERLASCCHNFPLINQCVSDAKAWIEQASHPLLFPVRPLGLHDVDSPLRFSAMMGYSGVISHDEKTVVSSWMENATKWSSNKLQILRLDTKEIIASKNLAKPTPFTITNDSKRVSYMDRNKIKICDLESGETFHEYVAFEAKTVATPRCCDTSSNDAFIAFGVRMGTPGQGTTGAWRKTSQIFLVYNSSEETKVHAAAGFYSRKHVDKLMFVLNNSQLIATSRERIACYSVPDLNELSNLTMTGTVFSNVWLQLPGNDKELFSIKLNHRSLSFITFNCLECKIDTTNIKENTGDEHDDKEKINMIGLHVKADQSIFIFCLVKKTIEKSESILYKSSRDGIEVTKWLLGTEKTIIASSLAVNANCDTAFVGWRRGQVSIVNLTEDSNKHIKTIAMHENLVQLISIIDNGKKLLTMAADRYLKVWDVERLLSNELDHAKHDAYMPDNSNNHNEGEISDEKLAEGEFISNKTTVNGIAVTDDILATVPPFSDMPPKLWQINTGLRLTELFKEHVKFYKKAYKASGSIFKKGSNGSVKFLDDLMIYKRHSRLSAYVYVTSNNEPLTNGFIDGFIFHIIPHHSMSSIKSVLGEESVFFVCEGELKVMMLRSLELLCNIPFPSIMQEVGDQETQGGRKRMSCFESALTLDGKYFLVINHSLSKSKYFDVIDIAQHSYIGRQDLMQWVLMQKVFHNIFYLVKRKTRESFELISLRSIQQTDKFDYKCLIEAKESNISKDGTFAFEIANKFAIAVWNLKTEKEEFYLRGHTAAIRSACISDDNRFLVSTSLDHTIRLWSLNNGQQLTLFHMPGAVNQIVITPSGRYIVAHYFTGFKKNHAVILKIQGCDLSLPNR